MTYNVFSGTLNPTHEINERAKYLGQRSVHPKVVVRTLTQRQTAPIALPGPLKWSENRHVCNLTLAVFYEYCKHEHFQYDIV